MEKSKFNNAAQRLVKSAELLFSSLLHVYDNSLWDDLAIVKREGTCVYSEYFKRCFNRQFFSVV